MCLARVMHGSEGMQGPGKQMIDAARDHAEILNSRCWESRPEDI